MSEHTKGAWDIQWRRGYRGEPLAAWSTHNSPDRFWECTIVSVDGIVARSVGASEQESVANARVIAAAPQLLTALEASVANHCPEDKFYCSTCSPARKLIAEARGLA